MRWIWSAILATAACVPAPREGPFYDDATVSDVTPRDLGPQGDAGGEPSDAGHLDAQPQVDLGPRPDGGVVTSNCDLTPFAPPTIVPERRVTDCTEAGVRAAVAQGGHVILACDGQTITLTSELVVQGELHLEGIGRVVLSGGDQTRLLRVPFQQRLVLQNLVLQGGRTDARGGAVWLEPEAAPALMIDVDFSNNTAALSGPDIGGGAIYTQAMGLNLLRVRATNNRASNGGALATIGTPLIIADSIFEANQATGTGGGAEEGGQGGIGGAIYIDGTGAGNFELCSGLISNNRSSAFGAGVFRYGYDSQSSRIRFTSFIGNQSSDPMRGLGAGLYHHNASLELSASTFSANAGSGGAGLFLAGALPVRIENSSFSGNVASGMLGGAIFVNGDVQAELLSSTLANNRAFFGGAVASFGQLTVRNSILANNLADEPFNGTNCAQALGDGGGNVQWPRMRPNGSEDTACFPSPRFVDPRLEPLGPNGGPTATMALQPGSGALDLGQNCPATDQRGRARATPCDSGAFEL